MVVNWGARKAVDLKIDTFICSAEASISFYTKLGFIVVDVTDVDMTIPSPSEEWKDMERKGFALEMVSLISGYVLVSTQ